MTDFFSPNGRTTRRDFWTFTLINAGGMFLVMWSLYWLEQAHNIRAVNQGVLAALAIYGLVAGARYVVLAVRRLHDIGHSGWMVWVKFVPLVGGFIVLLWFLSPGDYGDNAYGPDPREDPTAPTSF